MSEATDTCHLLTDYFGRPATLLRIANCPALSPLLPLPLSLLLSLSLSFLSSPCSLPPSLFLLPANWAVVQPGDWAVVQPGTGAGLTGLLCRPGLQGGQCIGWLLCSPSAGSQVLLCRPGSVPTKFSGCCAAQPTGGPGGCRAA